MSRGPVPADPQGRPMDIESIASRMASAIADGRPGRFESAAAYGFQGVGVRGGILAGVGQAFADTAPELARRAMESADCSATMCRALMTAKKLDSELFSKFNAAAHGMISGGMFKISEISVHSEADAEELDAAARARAAARAVIEELMIEAAGAQAAPKAGSGAPRL